jgi:hypothetical protein
MSGDQGQLRTMWVLPFAAAADGARLTLKRQGDHLWSTFSLPSRGIAVYEGH